MNKNRGTGAGGSNTNKNGLSYENKTSLDTHFEYSKQINGFTVVKFSTFTTEFVTASKTKFFKYMKDSMNKEIAPAHGCKQPDECFINNDNKTVFIIEKSFREDMAQFVKKFKRQILKFGNIKGYFQIIKSYTFIVFLHGLEKNAKVS